MKEDKIYRSLEYVRDEYLEDAADAMKRGRIANRFRRPRVWVIAAACMAMAVVMVALPIAKITSSDDPAPMYDMLDEIEEIQLSASDLAELFSIQSLDGSGTKRYSKVTIDDPTDFALTDEKYLPIYEYDPTGIPIDQEEYEEFSSSRKMRLLQAMGKLEHPFRTTEPSVDEDSIIGITYMKYLDQENEYRGHIGTVQRLYSNEIGYRQDQYYEQVYLDGELVAIHQGQSDYEIIASLQSIKEKLFTVFDDTFTDVKIVRFYRNNKEIAESIYVYFYNESDHPFNATSSRPRSDYIGLYFNNLDRTSGSQSLLSDDLLTQVDIDYVKLRVPATELYGVGGKAKTLPLEKAEEYLAQGYVFGGYHACPICYAEESESQPLVDFTDYDYVDLEYIEDITKINSEKHYTIPFYAFYKYIGENDDGEPLYAKTYVPAIEVEGIAEYFSHQS